MKISPVEGVDFSRTIPKLEVMDGAKQFAHKAHEGQTYGDEPYTVHLEAVVDIVGALKDPLLAPAYLETVAWLHDVLEDTDVSIAQLRAEFSDEVASAVWHMSDPDLPTRKERKAAVHERMSRLSTSIVSERAALLVKAADRLANLRGATKDGKDGLLKMYKAEHGAFRKAIYRAGLADGLWDELSELITPF